MPGGGLVQEVDGKQAGRLAVNGGLVPTEATNGGIARGGGAERVREGVTGHLPLEWVAPHEVGVRERLFPSAFWRFGFAFGAIAEDVLLQ